MDAVGYMLTARAITPQGQAELDSDLAAWGVEETPEPAPDEFEVWDEHQEALLWWCNGGGQLKFIATAKGVSCQGLDVVALKADAELSGRRVNPDDYQRMQLIARMVADHLNDGKHG